MHSIPEHLPKKLTISFWFLNYFLGAGKGDFYHDLEKRIIELKERGFNTIRMDAGIGLCYGKNGVPRGTIEFHELLPGYSAIMRQLNCKGGKCNVLKRLLELFTLAKKHNVYVILSNWFYLHTFWFVSDEIRNEMFAIPAEERLMYMAREYARILDLLIEKNLHTQIAFLETTNEFDGVIWGAFQKSKATAADNPEESERIMLRFRELHEEAIAFLREKYPFLLIAGDTFSAWAPVNMLPRNMQVWNYHTYYLWGLYTNSYEAELHKPDFDLINPYKYPMLNEFLSKKLTGIDEIFRSANFDERIEYGWVKRVWLFYNTDRDKLKKLDGWFKKKFIETIAVYKEKAAQSFPQAMEVKNKYFPGIPLVIGESGSYCAHVDFRWEEQSDEYWALNEFTTRLAKKNNYWGYMVRTNSGPEDPVWHAAPDRLKYINELFLNERN